MKIVMILMLGLFVGLPLTTSAMLQPRIINVPAGGDLQAAINSAQPGDRIILEKAGVENKLYTCSCTLPVKSGSAYITIESAGYAEIPTRSFYSTRPTTAEAQLMARIRSNTSTEPVFNAAPGSHHYKLLGLDLMPHSTPGQAYSIIGLGTNGPAQDTLAEVPHNFVLDKLWVHGGPFQEVQRGIALNSSQTAITNNWITDIHGRGYDTQAIGGWNGPGDYQIINNLIEGAGENLMFGGSDPSIPGLITSDVEIRRNYFFKPLYWRKGHPSFIPLPPILGSSLDHWSVKNLFELKNAQRFLIDGNVFENNWVDAQAGVAIVLKSANQDGRCGWCVTQHIMFSNNIVRHSAGAFSINAAENYNGGPRPPAANNITITNVLFDDITDEWADTLGQSRAIHIGNGAPNITINHVTMFHGYNILYGSDEGGLTNPNFTMTNSIVERRTYGIGVGGSEGAPYLNTKFNPYTYDKVVVMNTSKQGDEQFTSNQALQSRYPPGTFVVSGKDGVGFVNWQQGGVDYHNYALSPNSPFKGAATDGTDIGVNFAQLTAALGSTIPIPLPTPSPTPIPTPSPTPTPIPMPTPVPPQNSLTCTMGKWCYWSWPNDQAKKIAALNNAVAYGCDPASLVQTGSYLYCVRVR